MYFIFDEVSKKVTSISVEHPGDNVSYVERGGDYLPLEEFNYSLLEDGSLYVFKKTDFELSVSKLESESDLLGKMLVDMEFRLLLGGV